MQNNASITIEEVLARTYKVYNQLEALHISELEDARDLWQVQLDELIGERNRLVEKYGTEDHPRIKKLDARVAFNREFLLAQDKQIEMAKIEIPEFEAGAWRIHGRVFDEENNPVAGLTAALYDEQGKWIRELGFGKTNDKGYFWIDVSKEEGRRLEKITGQGLYLTLTEESGKLFCRLSEALHLAIGRIDYREVIKGVTPCQESPGKPVEDTEGEDTPAAWVINGQVVNKVDGSGIKGLYIHLFGEEGRFAEQFDPATTDESGVFRIELYPNQHPEFFKAKPAVFLHVLSGARVRYATKDPIFPEAGKEEKKIRIEI